MTTPSSVIVNAVFLAFYAVLLVPTICNVFQHGRSRRAGFIFLLVFCLGE